MDLLLAEARRASAALREVAPATDATRVGLGIFRERRDVTKRCGNSFYKTGRRL